MKVASRENLKQLRMQENMTQREVAEVLGVSVRTYQNYEQGMRTPPLPMAKKIADLFMCKIDEIFFTA